MPKITIIQIQACKGEEDHIHTSQTSFSRSLLNETFISERLSYISDQSFEEKYLCDNREEGPDLPRKLTVKPEQHPLIKRLGNFPDSHGKAIKKAQSILSNLSSRQW